jgi:hypothetical protein
MCDVGPEHEVDSQKLYDAFCRWAEDQGHQRMAAPTFGGDLFALNVGIKKGRSRTRHPMTGESVNGSPIYRGIALIGGNVRVLRSSGHGVHGLS